MKKNCLLFIFCFIAVNSYSLQKHTFFIQMNFSQMQFSDSIAAIVKKLSKHNIFESATVGFAGVSSEQYKLYEKLSNTASQNELIDLATSNKNAVVRLYAVRALIKRNGITPDIGKQFKNDESMVSTLYGCVGGKAMVKEIFMSLTN